MAKLIAVVATDRANGIGYRNEMPWYVPEDLKHFKELTEGGIVVMGGNTARSIGKPLPNRQNWVISKRLAADPDVFGPEWKANSVTAFGSIPELLRYIAKNSALGDIFVIGGESIYKQLLPYCTEVYQTVMETYFVCDTKFPDFLGWGAWKYDRIGQYPSNANRPFEVNILKHTRDLAEERSQTQKNYDM